MSPRGRAKHRRANKKKTADDSECGGESEANCSQTTQGVAKEVDDCDFVIIMPSAEKLISCVFLLLAVYVMRECLVVVFKYIIRVETVPTGFKFPAWEGPVFLAEYLAVCDSTFLVISSECSWHVALGGGMLMFGPLLVIIGAIYYYLLLLTTPDYYL